MQGRGWLVVGLAGVAMVGVVSAGTAAATTTKPGEAHIDDDHYDSFRSKGGYTLADYQQRWAVDSVSARWP